jgi:RNA polymerase sigma factor (sigma-70 family)
MTPMKRPRFVSSEDKDKLLAHTYSHEQLIEGAKRGSRAHIEQLIRKHGDPLVERITHFDPDVTALGVLSEVALRLPAALASYEERDKFDAFLWTIAKTIIIDMQRQRRRRSRDVSARQIGLRATPTPHKQLELVDLVERLTVALSPRAREAWTRPLEGFGNQDIAEAMGMTPNAVGAMLSRSRKILQERAAELKLGRADFKSSGANSDLVFGPED